MGPSARLARPTVDTCRYRTPAPEPGDGMADCGLLGQLLAGHPEASPRVERRACEACCRSFPPSPAAPNPVISSLVYSRAHDLLQSGRVPAGRALARRVEPFLDIVVAPPPAADGADASGSLRLFEHPPNERPLMPTLLDLLPFPRRHCGTAVEHWAVGVTTAPRRHATLERCLDSLARAGWPRPVLFADGNVAVAERFRSLPSICRDEPLGAWPHYYLAMTELLMREPLADAFLLVQDDALFFDRENVREYLSEMLWPGSTPGIVSLYCATPDQRPKPGWGRFPGRWRSGAVAFVFPRQILIDLLHDPKVLAHRWSPDGDGLVAIPDTIAEWAERRGVPFYLPTPSLVQHIGAASAIWNGSYELTPAREAGVFAGDAAESAPADHEATVCADRPAPAPFPMRFELDHSAAEFPEEAFPCTDPTERAYRPRVARGRERMRNLSVVVNMLCRDVVHSLPAAAARIERLSQMFARCQTVVFENDSRDATPRWLERWAQTNSTVHLAGERLGAPRFAHGIGRERTASMAYYRNRCRETVLESFPDYDYVIVLDADLEGGFSYDGIAHTFGAADWDFVGSYGIWYEAAAPRSALNPVHYDAFAFRRSGHDDVEDFRTINMMKFRRGAALLPVWSCFGGLGIYRRECFEHAMYEGGDCEHVTFHRALRACGLDRLFMNPSQIVLYGDVCPMA